MDISKPMMLVYNQDGSARALVDGKTVLLSGPHFATELFVERAVLASQAFDVMMRRKWRPITNVLPGWWVLGDDENPVHLPLHRDSPAIYADPFTALVEADRWYKENVEERGPAHSET